MEFEFNEQLTPLCSLEVENVGSVAIEACDEDGFFYYLIVKSLAGDAIIATSGPVIPDTNIIPALYKASLDKIPYNEAKIQRAIDRFLNPPKVKIINANIVDFNTAAKEFKDIAKYLETLSIETL